jgi:peptidase E
VATLRQIFAYSGVLATRTQPRKSLDLLEHAIGLAAAAQADPGRPTRICYVPTAVGDSDTAIDSYAKVFAERDDVDFSVLKLFTQPSVPDVRTHLSAQHLIFVEGGSVVNLTAVWRAHGLPKIMRDCWDAGVVLAGPSAGSLCWHLGGPTDSFRDALDAYTDGLGLLPFSNGVHDDFDEQPRRVTYRRMIADGTLPAGYATEDGVGLHYIDTEMHEAVAILEGKLAWRVEPSEDGGYAETAIKPRLI